MARVICKDCDCIIDTERDDYIEVNGEYVCVDCMDDYAECYECNEWYNVNDMYETEDGYLVCHDCRCDYYYSCVECGDLVHQDNVRWTIHDDPLCEHCAENYYYYCDECGYYASDDEWNDDEGMCVQCAPRSNVIKGYHYHKGFAPKYFDIVGMHENIEEVTYDELNALIGLEVETRTDNGREATAKELAEIMGDRAYFEYDCSVDYEMILQPHTYTALVYSDEIRKAFDYLKENCYAYDTGMHVHISRTAFGDTVEEQNENIAKLVILHNEGFAFEQLVKLSRREDFQMQWCRPLTMKNRMTKTELKDRAKSFAEYDGGHGVAINCENSKTVEFRLGSGTVDYDEMLNWVNVIKTMVLACKTVDIDNADNFYVWFTEADERLKKYMESRGVKWELPKVMTVEDCKDIMEKLMDNMNKMLGEEEANTITYNTLLTLAGVDLQTRVALGYR